MSGSVLNLSIDNRYAVPFLVLLVLAAVVYFLAGPLMMRPFPDSFASDRQGQLLVRVGGQWLAVDEDRSLDFRPMEIEAYRGPLLELDDGSWLINTGGQYVTHLQRLRRFIQLSPGEGEISTLERCRNDFLHCRLWGANELELVDDFALVELDEGRFALADTERHRVYLLDGNGEILDRYQGASFPNDLLWHDEALYLVDTNGQRVTRFETAGNRFGQPETVFRLRDHDVTRNRPMPIRLTFADGYWWLLATNLAMMNGELFRIDPDWQRVHRMADPLLTDVVALAPYDGGLMLATFRGDHLLYFDPVKESLAEVEPPGLAGYLGELEQEVAARKRTTWLQVALLLSLAIGFLVWGLRHAKAPDDNSDSAESGQAMHAADGPYWFNYKTRTLNMLRNMMLAGLVSIPVMVLLLVWLSVAWFPGAAPDDSAGPAKQLLIVTWLSMLMLGAFMVTAAREMSKWKRYRLGVDGRQILLAVDDDTVYHIKPQELQYSTNALFWGRRMIPLKLGNGQKLIDDDQLDRLLFPLLERHGQRLGSLQMVWVQLSRRDPMTVASMLLVLGLAGLGLYMKLTVG